jgi:hypothetical protein
MSFYTDPKQYTKTLLSDLQGAWENLRESVVQESGFPDWERLLFHIDEAMSWESVRDLDRMHSTLTLIQNIADQAEVPSEVIEWIETIREHLAEVFAAIARGEKL